MYYKDSNATKGFKFHLSNSDRDAEGNDDEAKRKEHNREPSRCLRFWIVVAKPHGS